jgi:predicted phage terminase large subunit-like protein
MAITEALPSWFLGKYPDKQVIALAYGDDLAQRFGRRNKTKLEKYGKRLFDIEVSKTKNANDDFEIEGHLGRMITRGIMSGITGNAGNLVLIDDPVKTKEEAYSDAYREKVWGEWQNSVKTRLGSGAKVVLIMTRWHEDDLAGRILDTEDHVTHINIPCEAEENDVIGRKPGEGLFPEIGKGTEWKDSFKQSYINSEGMDTWNALFQGRPSAQKGNIFKRDWWKFYDILPELYSMVLSVDATFKDKATSDKVAMTVWGKSGTKVYLVDLINRQMGFVDTIDAIKNFKAKYPKITMILIEDKANGSAIIDTLKREIMGVVPVEPLGSKESRARAVTAFIEAGNVWLPRKEAWTEEFIDQHAKFPKGKWDDLVDSTSQALIRFKDFIANAPLKEKERDYFAEPETTNKYKLKNIRLPKAFFKY